MGLHSYSWSQAVREGGKGEEEAHLPIASCPDVCREHNKLLTRHGAKRVWFQMLPLRGLQATLWLLIGALELA